MGFEAEAHSNSRDSHRPFAINLVLVCVLCLAAVASLLVGASQISVTSALRGLTGSDEIAAIIVREIRLPRMLLAVGVGAMLGLAGAAIQALTRNPLAEPAVLEVLKVITRLPAQFRGLTLAGVMVMAALVVMVGLRVVTVIISDLQALHRHREAFLIDFQQVAPVVEARVRPVVEARLLHSSLSATLFQ